MNRVLKIDHTKLAVVEQHEIPRMVVSVHRALRLGQRRIG